MPDNIHQQLEALFKDFECLIASPNGDATAALHSELEALRVRLLEVGAQFLESEKSSANAQAVETHPATSLLYEKDRVGYIYTFDQLESLGQLSAAKTNSDRAFSIPITANGQMIGDLQIAPPLQRAWTTEEMSLVDDVVKQTSLQIQNLRLLTATERARSELNLPLAVSP